MPTCSRITCEQNTPTRHIFSCLRACFMLSHTTLAQVFVRFMPSMFHALVCLTSLRLSTLHSSESLPSSTSSSIDRAVSSSLFTQEQGEPAGRRQAFHSPEESLLSSQSLSVGHVRMVRPVNEFGSLSSSVRENPCRDSEIEQIRILPERQKEQILADCRAEIQKHDSQADYDRRSIQKLNEINRALAGDEQFRRDQQLLHERLLQQNLELREAHQKGLTEMEESRKFQSSTFDTIARRRLVEDQDTILELTSKIQELQNEINCMSDLKEFQDAESIRS